MNKARKRYLTTSPDRPGKFSRRSLYSIVFGAVALCVGAALLVIGAVPSPVADMSDRRELIGDESAGIAAESALSPANVLHATNSATANSTRSTARHGAGQHQIANSRSGEDDSRRIVTNSLSRAAGDRLAKDDDLAMPEWRKIINPDGSAVDVVGRNGRGGTNGIPDYLELYPAFEAGFIEEVISNGVATDMSALLVATDISDEVLYNGAVSAAHDLGNAFYLLTVTPSGNLRFYFVVERLRGDLPTFIEFELNQSPMRVTSGMPWWNIQGARLDGDILVRFNLMAGTLTSVELAEWRNGGYFIFETDIQGLGQGCRDRFSYIYCIGQPPLDRSNQVIEVWDEDSAPVEPTLANSFVELGLDMRRLMGSGSEYSSVYVRTPEDVVLSSFAGIGSRAGLSLGSL